MGKERKVALDTNVLISALGWKGNPHKIFEKVIAGDIDLFISFERPERMLSSDQEWKHSSSFDGTSSDTQ